MTNTEYTELDGQAAYAWWLRGWQSAERHYNTVPSPTTADMVWRQEIDQSLATPTTLVAGARVVRKVGPFKSGVVACATKADLARAGIAQASNDLTAIVDWGYYRTWEYVSDLRPIEAPEQSDENR